MERAGPVGVAQEVLARNSPGALGLAPAVFSRLHLPLEFSREKPCQAFSSGRAKSEAGNVQHSLRLSFFVIGISAFIKVL